MSKVRVQINLPQSSSSITSGGVLNRPLRVSPPVRPPQAPLPFPPPLCPFRLRLPLPRHPLPLLLLHLLLRPRPLFSFPSSLSVSSPFSHPPSAQRTVKNSDQSESNWHTHLLIPFGVEFSRLLI